MAKKPKVRGRGAPESAGSRGSGEATPQARDVGAIAPTHGGRGGAKRAPSRGATPDASWVPAALGFAFLASGAAGLMHEVVWTRLLGHIFGVSSFAISTVLAAYMGGLALGSWWIGTRTARIGDSRRVYAYLELGIGAFALAVPAILGLVEPLYGEIWRRFHLSFGVFTVLRFLLAGAILLLPTALMGATLPVLADDLVRRAGRSLPPHILYALNLAGAIVGVAIAGFLLMPNLGVWGTIATAAIVNIGVGLAVLALPPTPPRPETEGDVDAAERDAHQATADAPSRQRARAGTRARERFAPPPAGWLLALSAFVSGYFTLSTQVAWSRVLSLVVGSTTFAFTSVLLVYLVALGAGSALAARLGRDRGRAGIALAASFAACALLSILAVILVHRLPSWYLDLFSIWGPEVQNGIVLRGLGAAFIVMFAPILAAGTVLPLTLAAAQPDDDRETGRVVGRIYAINTLGSITGAFLGGFVLVPGVGTQRTLVGGGLVCVVAGLAHAFGRERPLWLRPVAVTTTVLALLGALLVPRWDHMKLHAGVFESSRHFSGLADLRKRLDMAAPDALGQRLYEREGRTASVVVMQTGPVLGMKIDARANASNDPSDMGTQILLALYPLSLAKKAEDVFIVGWGSGVTVGAALQTPVRSVTAVELEPAVVEASQHFNFLNHEPLADPRVHLFEDDARHILLASDATYDVIISEPPHPWIAGVANLFTQDFYRLAAERLRPGGVFAQWVQSYQISFDTYRTILASFQSVFPHTYVLYVIGSIDTILIGSREPISFDVAELEKHWLRPETKAEFERIGMTKPEFILAGVAIGPDQVREVVRNAPINTDDNMLVEFQATRGTTTEGAGQSILWELERRATPLEGIVPDPESFAADRSRMLSYVEGMHGMERDASALEKALGIEPPPAADGAGAAEGMPEGEEPTTP